MKITQLFFTLVFISILQASFAQNEVYIPFNKKVFIKSEYFTNPQIRYAWGFADTTGTVVLPCEYKNVGYYKDGFFTVYNKGAWGVVNIRNEVVIDFKYKSIQIDKDLFIVKQGNESAVVDLNGDIVIDFEKQEITVHRQYIEIKPSGKRKTIYNRFGEKLVPDKAYFSTAFEYGDDTYFIFGIQHTNALAKITSNRNDPVEILIDTSQGRQIIITDDQKYFKITKTNAPFYLYRVKDILESKSLAKTLEKKGKDLKDFPEYYRSGLSKTLFGKNHEKERELWQKIADIKSTPFWKLSSIKIDSSYLLVFDVIRWGDGFGSYSLRQDTLPTKYKDISFIPIGHPRSCSHVCLKFQETYDTLQANLAIVSNEKGVKGILDTKLNAVIPFEYEEIKPYFYNLDCREPLFICKKEGKWGIIDLSNQPVVKFTYDEIKNIEYNYYPQCFDFSTGIAAKKNGKYGIIDLKENELAPFIFDEIFYNKSIKSFSLEKSGKYGLLTDEKYIPPVYDYQIKEIVSFNEYDVFKTTYGYYIDSKGVLYFDH